MQKSAAKQLHTVCEVVGIRFSIVQKTLIACIVWRAIRLYGSDCCDGFSPFFPQFQTAIQLQKYYITQ